MPTPSKASFGGSRKDQNAAHSRVYRLLKKQHTEELASEIAALRAEAAQLIAAHGLTEEGPVVPQPAEPNAADDAAHGAAVCDRAARKALAAKAARKRTRERLARLEAEADACRVWVGALRAKTAGDACISAAGAMIALAATCVEAGSAEDARARSEAGSEETAPLPESPCLPPKKRQRAELGSILISD